MTLVVAVGFAVVGLAAPSSAHHNTITGSVSCRTGGGWEVTWQVVNSEQRTEQITSSNRPSAVPVGTTFSSYQTRSFREVLTTKPGSTVTLTLGARWSNGVTQVNSGSIPASSFSDACNTTRVAAPTVPVVDECGPGNAHYGTVPSGPWTSVVNRNGSLTITANPGYVFTNGQTVITYPVPTDSNAPCIESAPQVPVVDDCGPGNAHYGTVPSGPWTSVLNPDGSLTITADEGHAFPGGRTVITYPVPTDSNVPCVASAPQVPVIDDCGPGNAHYGTVPSGPWTSVLNANGSLTITANPGHSFGNGQSVITLPVPTDTQQPCPVSPPEVLPAEVRVVKAKAKQIDKCGTRSDLFKVSKRAGVVYTVNGTVLHQGVWLKARTLKHANTKGKRPYSVTVRAQSADATYRLEGKQVWRLRFSTRPCAKAPEIAPHTGS
ncbi:exported hypothetical protein [metagenome]|uniref:Uncharacterized protein n=1 Tax=metagenome TaxID=256318 RepID=A0A2P2CJ12_9ZZZZ